MILDFYEAKEALRVDGDHNDFIIQSILQSIPPYLEATTGKDWMEDDKVHPLAKTVSKFLLQLWFDPQDQDAARMKRTIDNLLVTLTAIGRSKNGT